MAGTYEDQSQVAICALSYRVMARAELESFLEERAIEIAKATIAAWNDQGKVSRTTMCLLGFSGQTFSKPPDTLEAPGANQLKGWNEKIEIGQRLTAAVSSYVGYIITENHGVREKNLMAILLPLGISADNLDPLFVADMDDFGRRRGEAAHTSSIGQVTPGIDPQSEFDAVVRLMSQISAIDAILDDVLASARVA